MRFMMLMIPNLKNATDYGIPSADAVAAMTRYNKELADAGALISLDGLQPPEKGARVSFDAARKPVVTDGPFAEAKEVVGGYWIIQAKSLDEAKAWARKCPGDPGNVIEIRPIFEMSDFPEDVQKAAKL
jgi:hypothetical protein